MVTKVGLSLDGCYVQPHGSVSAWRAGMYGHKGWPQPGGLMCGCKSQSQTRGLLCKAASIGLSLEGCCVWSQKFSVCLEGGVYSREGRP